MISKIDRRQFLITGSATAGLITMGTEAAQESVPGLRIVGLKTDYIDRPLGLETKAPSLSWRLESTQRAIKQKKYRVVVSSTREGALRGQGDLWDSGEIASSRSFSIEYRGRSLVSRQQCWWRVEVWDNRGSHAQSDITWWEMGLLSPEDWSAQWLAVEDAMANADRTAGFRWIWKAAPDQVSAYRFRGRFDLPAVSRTGALFVQGAQGTQIKSLWIDAVPIERGDALNLAGEWLTMGSFEAGDHVIAIEVESADYPPPLPHLVPGLAFFARFDLESSQTLHVASGSDWKVSTVSREGWQGKEFDDSRWAGVEIVPLEAQPWPATPAMHLRRPFIVNDRVVQARLYATALGVYEARLNGLRVGDALLTPEMSQYAKRLLYRAYDVTKQIRSGANLLGLTVGDGWYAGFEGRYAWGLPPRRVIAQLELTFADGKKEVIVTGRGWRVASSAIQVSKIRQGEVYDARLEEPGWDTATFDDSHWSEVDLAEAPPCQLVAQVSAPIRAVQVLKPRSISQLKPGVQVVDFGQNFGGWCRLRVQSKRGTRIELKFSELVKSSGELDQSSMGFDIGEPGKLLPKTDVFVLKGTGSVETFEPKFTHRGFRYVQVSGLASPSTLISIEGVVVHSDFAMTGQLRIDSPLIMQIWRNVLWTQRSNFLGVQTDNPSREQRAWLADAAIFADTAAFNMDTCTFTSRRLDDVRDDQSENGAMPQIAPNPKRYNLIFPNVLELGSTPAWGDAPLILAWTAWRHYGDTAVIARNWDAMNRYVQFILDANPDCVWRHKRGLAWGDHLAVGQAISLNPKVPRATSLELIGTAYWAHSTDILAQMAQAIGKSEDAQRLEKLFGRIRQAFNESYVQLDGTVDNGSQTSQVLALKFGLLSPELARRAVQKLAVDVKAHGGALTTGILGTQFILDVLADHGFSDLAYGLLLRTEYPSWGYMIENGATTIWESWNKEEHAAGCRNQPAFGSVGGFLFRRIAGIDAATPGFESIVIKPALDPRISHGGGDYDSVMGRISTDWRHESDGSLLLQISLPANTTAQLHLPARQGGQIKEGREEISRHSDLRIVERHDDEVVIEVGSGTYRFLAQV